jgi:hypothetical protein
MKRSPLSIFFLLTAAVLGAALTSGAIAQAVESPEGVQEIDLSLWVQDNSKWGNTAFRKGEFYMRAKQDDRYFYVLVAPDDYSTARSNTRVTLRNPKGLRTKLGYGLIFHSNPEPLKQDYVFVIDTVTGRYRVVRHRAGKELKVVRWTRSPFIRRGRLRNDLEIRDRGDTVDLYINRRFVRTLRPRFAFPDGQPGLYTDATPIAFKNLIVSPQGTNTRSVAKLNQPWIISGSRL